MHFVKHALVLAGVAFAFAAGGAQQAGGQHKSGRNTDGQDTAQSPAQPASSSGVMGYGVKLGGFFNEQHKQAARKYFQRYQKGKDCPEGMERNEAKVCKPPVEGRYWAVGQPLQKAVTTYPIPEQLATQLPPPPAGYEYLRAGEDILLVSKSSVRLVVDMIENVMG
jgi:Ni/Co efflux regulator RcnB